MERMEIDYDEQDLDNLIIKDKKYYAQRRKKIIFILIPIFIVLIIITVVLVIVFKPKNYNNITCQFQANNADEDIILINNKNNWNFTLIIDGSSHNKKNSHKFGNTDIHNVTFEFKEKLDSLEGFFEGNRYIITADFSKLKTDNITSMANLFKGCSNLKMKLKN